MEHTSGDISDLMKIDIACSIAFALLFCVARMAYLTVGWYGDVLYNKGQMDYLQERADTYIFEKKDAVVTGNDIMELILKNDSKFDYHIFIDEKWYCVNNTIRSAASNIWCEDYLMSHVFKNRGDLERSFYVSEVIQVNEETIGYRFIDKISFDCHINTENDGCYTDSADEH